MKIACDVHKCQFSCQLCSDFKTGCIRDQVHVHLLHTKRLYSTPTCTFCAFVEVLNSIRSGVSDNHEYHSAENNYRCKSLINSKTISVSKKITEIFCRTY